MKNREKFFGVVLVTFLSILMVGSSSVVSGAEPVAAVSMTADTILFSPKAAAEGVDLRIAVPDGTVNSYVYQPGITPVFYSKDFSDGLYAYELRVVPTGTKVRGDSSTETSTTSAPTQSGTFRIDGGAFVLPAPESIGLLDVVHYDDVIITGSLCVGFDCTDGLSFGFDTIILKENNLRVFFDDTSTSAGFPANDWRIIANDSASGGASYFAIEDSTGAKTPFKIVAGARTNALYVNSSGKVGLGTSVPVLNLHILSGDTPAARLDQDGSVGYTAQVWDISGNESNFFVRDTTGGSKLPFRIQPGTPTNALTLRADGKVGMGTWSPGYALEIQKTGENAAVVVNRTDGASNYMNSTATHGNFGTVNNFPTRMMVNSAWKLQLNADNSLSMASGASCTAGGTWTNSSSIELKENVDSLTADEALVTLANLNPVKFNYKVDKAEKHVGFIAEEVPELVASRDRKGMSPMDVTAVLTRVVQEQQKIIEKLNARIEELERKVR